MRENESKGQKNGESRRGGEEYLWTLRKRHGEQYCVFPNRAAAKLTTDIIYYIQSKEIALYSFYCTFRAILLVPFSCVFAVPNYRLALM
jgi:hypothetical protein